MKTYNWCDRDKPWNIDHSHCKDTDKTAATIKMFSVKKKLSGSTVIYNKVTYFWNLDCDHWSMRRRHLFIIEMLFVSFTRLLNCKRKNLTLKKNLRVWKLLWHVPCRYFDCLCVWQWLSCTFLQHITLHLKGSPKKKTIYFETSV